MNKKKSLGIVATVFVSGIIVLVAMFVLVGPLLSHSDAQQVSCKKTGVTHIATVKDGKIDPKDTQAKLCDNLTIVNDDNKDRLMAFGKHEKHIKYGGVTEELLKPGQSLTVPLNQRGTYLFHDHYDEDVSGDFTVTE